MLVIITHDRGITKEISVRRNTRKALYDDINCPECPNKAVISVMQSKITRELEQSQREKTTVQHYQYLEELGFIKRVTCRKKGIVEEKKICFTAKGIILYLWIQYEHLKDSDKITTFCKLLNEEARHIFYAFSNNFEKRTNEIRKQLGLLPTMDYFIFLSYYILYTLEKNNKIRVLTRYFPPYYSKQEKQLMDIIHQKRSLDRTKLLHEFLNKNFVFFQWYSTLSKQKQGSPEITNFLTAINMNKSREIINFIIDPQQSIEKMKKIALDDLVARLDVLYFMINYYSFQIYLKEGNQLVLCNTLNEFLTKLDKVLTILFTITLGINRRFEDDLQKMALFFLPNTEVPILSKNRDKAIQEIENQFELLSNYLSDNCVSSDKHVELNQLSLLSTLLKMALDDKSVLEALCKIIKEKQSGHRRITDV